MMVLMIMYCTNGRFLKICAICFQGAIFAGTRSGLGFSLTKSVVIRTVTAATTPKIAPVMLYAPGSVAPMPMNRLASIWVAPAPRMYPITVKIMRMEMSEVRSL